MLDKAAEKYTPQEALMLIMKVGFSTSKSVSKYSGRGVGMDVVNTVVNEFGGRVEIESNPGAGTSIALFMPVSVTAVASLGFAIGPYTCFLPLFNVDKIFSKQEAQQKQTEHDGKRFFIYEKKEIPILDLHSIFAVKKGDAFLLIAHSMGNYYGFTADEIMGETVATSKPLPFCLDQKWQFSTGIRNGTLSSDGSIGFVLNAALLDALSRKTEDEQNEE